MAKLCLSHPVAFGSSTLKHLPAEEREKRKEKYEQKFNFKTVICGIKYIKHWVNKNGKRTLYRQEQHTFQHFYTHPQIVYTRAMFTGAEKRSEKRDSNLCIIIRIKAHNRQ